LAAGYALFAFTKGNSLENTHSPAALHMSTQDWTLCTDSNASRKRHKYQKLQCPSNVAGASAAEGGAFEEAMQALTMRFLPARDHLAA